MNEHPQATAMVVAVAGVMEAEYLLLTARVAADPQRGQT